MGYLSISNLYRDQRVLEGDKVWCLEKIHGCSSWVSYTRTPSDYTDSMGVKTHGNFHYHGGGVTGAEFKALFNTDELEPKLVLLADFYGTDKVTVYGESYGGKMQKNQWRYGPVLKFVAFDVNIDNDFFLSVPEAFSAVKCLGLDFVHHVLVETKLSEVDKWRDAISEQAVKNGVTTHDGEFIRREGIVIRPVVETVDHQGNRIIAKHKRDEERETKTPRKVVDPSKLEVLKNARVIAEEWATKTRIYEHIIPKLGFEVVDMTAARAVISATIDDIHREGSGEFEPSPTVNAEMGKRTAQLLKQYLANKLADKA